jgi:hypothetical protein
MDGRPAGIREFLPLVPVLGEHRRLRNCPASRHCSQQLRRKTDHGALSSSGCQCVSSQNSASPCYIRHTGSTEIAAATMLTEGLQLCGERVQLRLFLRHRLLLLSTHGSCLSKLALRIHARRVSALQISTHFTRMRQGLLRSMHRLIRGHHRGLGIRPGRVLALQLRELRLRLLASAESRVQAGLHRLRGGAHRLVRLLGLCKLFLSLLSIIFSFRELRFAAPLGHGQLTDGTGQICG